MIALADPRGGARDARPPPWGSKFFHFHAVFGKKLKNNSTFGSWRPPLGKILDPPLDRIGNLSKCTSLLPPANEVWGKIIFSQASVILSTGRGVDTPQHYGIRTTSGRYASYWNAFLLPPANEVWGKVIFLHQFVILFTGGEGGMHGCSQGGCGCSGGHAWLLWGCMVLFGSVCGFSGGACMVLFGGHAWFYSGEMHGFIWGACVVLFGGVHGFIQGDMHGFIQGGVCGFSGGGMHGFSGGLCMVFSVFSDTMRYDQ